MTAQQDAITMLDAAVASLEKTTSSYRQMVTKYGNDPTQWPNTTNWYKALADLRACRKSILAIPVAKLTAEFSAKEA